MLHVLASQIVHLHVQALKAVPVLAAYQMVHVHTAVQHVHIQTPVMVIIPAVPGDRRLVRAHVRVVPAMPEQPPAHVLAEHAQSIHV